MSFPVAKSCLEPMRPITVKLQRSNIDLYEAYEMIDATIDRLKGYRNDIDQEFQEWFYAATTLVESAGGVVSQPRVSGRQQHHNNSPAETPEAYNRRNVAISFLDHLLKEMETRFDQSSRTSSVIFKLIPKLAVDDLQDLCDKLMFWRTDLSSPMSLLSELKYWKSSHSKDLTVTNLSECLRCCDRDVFPNIYELLCLGCVAPVSSCEAEKSFSGVRRIKTHLRKSMTVFGLQNLLLCMYITVSK